MIYKLKKLLFELGEAFASGIIERLKREVECYGDYKENESR